MILIQNGEYPLEDFRATVACQQVDEYDPKGCGNVYQISFDDLVLRSWKGTHFFHYYAAICCPNCGKYTRVGGLPRNVQYKLFTAERKAGATFDGFAD